jgi:hypothetical protein
MAEKGGWEVINTYGFWGWSAFAIALGMFVSSLRVTIKSWQQKDSGFMMFGILGTLFFGIIVFSFCFHLYVFFL